MKTAKSKFSTRQKILDTATRMFAEHGFDGVSVRDIIKAAKVNLGAITYHFGGKEQLLAEVLAGKTGPMIESGEKIVAGAGTPQARLRRLLEEYAMGLMHENPGVRVLVAESMLGGRRLPNSVAQAIEWRNQAFARIVNDGIKAGVFRPCDVESAAWHFFGMLSSYILYRPKSGRVGRFGRYPKPQIQRAVDAAMDVFMNGLLADGARDGRRG